MARDSDFEAMLDRLIGKAADISHAGFRLIDSHLPEGFSRDRVPESTVYRLHIVATSAFRSGLICVKAPETALTALGLLRGLLEAWAHLEFIRNSDYGGDPACRALRFERGIHKEWGNAVDLASGPDLSEIKDAHAEHLRALDQIWRDHGCKGRERTQGNVAETITEKLAKQPFMEWLPQMWKVTSASLHMLGSDYLFESSDGESWLVWAPDVQRALWFRFNVATYVYLTWTAASILGAEDAVLQAFQGSGREIIMDPDLVRITSRPKE
jgi:hypothetical protein